MKKKSITSSRIISKPTPSEKDTSYLLTQRSSISSRIATENKHLSPLSQFKPEYAMKIVSAVVPHIYHGSIMRQFDSDVFKWSLECVAYGLRTGRKQKMDSILSYSLEVVVAWLSSLLRQPPTQEREEYIQSILLHTSLFFENNDYSYMSNTLLSPLQGLFANSEKIPDISPSTWQTLHVVLFAGALEQTSTPHHVRQLVNLCLDSIVCANIFTEEQVSAYEPYIASLMKLAVFKDCWLAVFCSLYEEKLLKGEEGPSYLYFKRGIEDRFDTVYKQKALSFVVQSRIDVEKRYMETHDDPSLPKWPCYDILQEFSGWCSPQVQGQSVNGRQHRSSHEFTELFLAASKEDVKRLSPLASEVIRLAIIQEEWGNLLKLSPVLIKYPEICGEFIPDMVTNMPKIDLYDGNLSAYTSLLLGSLVSTYKNMDDSVFNVIYDKMTVKNQPITLAVITIICLFLNDKETYAWQWLDTLLSEEQSPSTTAVLIFFAGLLPHVSLQINDSTDAVGILERAVFLLENKTNKNWKAIDTKLLLLGVFGIISHSPNISATDNIGQRLFALQSDADDGEVVFYEMIRDSICFGGGQSVDTVDDLSAVLVTKRSVIAISSGSDMLVRNGIGQTRIQVHNISQYEEDVAELYPLSGDILEHSDIDNAFGSLEEDYSDELAFQCTEELIPYHKVQPQEPSQAALTLAVDIGLLEEDDIQNIGILSPSEIHTLNSLDSIPYLPTISVLVQQLTREGDSSKLVSTDTNEFSSFVDSLTPTCRRSAGIARHFHTGYGKISYTTEAITRTHILVVYNSLDEVINIAHKDFQAFDIVIAATPINSSTYYIDTIIKTPPFMITLPLSHLTFSIPSEQLGCFIAMMSFYDMASSKQNSTQLASFTGGYIERRRFIDNLHKRSMKQAIDIIQPIVESLSVSSIV